MSTIPTYNEKELLSKIAAGDEQAFAAIFNHYYPLLFTYVNRIVQSSPETENILQEIFMKIWQSREALQYVDRFGAYLWVMSRHHALNAMRNLARRSVLLDEFSRQAPAPEPDGTWEWQLSLIDQAVAHLPEQYRRVWTMNRIDKMKQAEIAEALGIALPTVKKYMQQAVVLITQYVKDHSSLSFAITIVLSLFLKKNSRTIYFLKSQVSSLCTA